MRRKLLSTLFALGVITLPMGAGAIEGPTDVLTPFGYFIRELDSPNRVYWDESISNKVGGDGWSFGERLAYACAWGEHYTDLNNDNDNTEAGEVTVSSLGRITSWNDLNGDGDWTDDGELDFELHLELLLGAGYQPGSLELGDRNGVEENNNSGVVGPCGDGQGPGATLDYSETLHGDHHPHSDVEDTGDIVFYRDVDNDGFVDDEFARFAAGVLANNAGEGAFLNAGDPVPAGGPDCDEMYWSPGNGTAGPSIIFWWDDDGPQQSMPGVDIPCPNSGPGEPSAVALLTVQDLAAGVGYCVEDSMDGDVCVNVTFQPPSDTTAPVTTIACNGGSCGGVFTDPVTVTLSATDSESGVALTEYSVDGTSPSVLYTGPFVVSADTFVQFRSTDAAGNVEATQSQAVDFIPVVTAPSGPSEIRCPDGSVPTVTSTSPLQVSCP